MSQEQKVKLSVARAVLLNPSVLLLDDVAGSLKFDIGRSVQDAIDAIMLGRSTLIITQRLSLIKNSDYIAVMEEGQLVEVGTHDELSSLNGLYSELLRYEEALKLPERFVPLFSFYLHLVLSCGLLNMFRRYNEKCYRVSILSNIK